MRGCHACRGDDPQPLWNLPRNRLHGARRRPQSVPDKRTLQRASAGAFGDDDATVARRSPSSLVLLTRRRGTLRERPYAVCEFQHQQPVVLASRPQRAPRRVKMNLRRAPIGTAGDPTPGTEVVGPRARGGHSSRVVIGDLLWLQWIADVEDADAGIEVTAGQRGRVMLVIHAAVMAAVGESGETYDVGDNHRTRFGSVYLQHQSRYACWIGLI